MLDKEDSIQDGQYEEALLKHTILSLRKRRKKDAHSLEMLEAVLDLLPRLEGKDREVVIWLTGYESTAPNGIRRPDDAVSLFNPYGLAPEEYLV